ncbi:MAG TPA: cyanophycin synthetase, partial [Actinomycetota bacterium]
GTAVLNADDPVVRSFAGRTRVRTVLFGAAPDAEIRADEVTLDDGGRASFSLRTPDGVEPVELSVPGEHMVSNALAAAAVGTALGLSAAECAAGLKGARLSAWRMEVRDGPDGLVVLNDAYNANPTSMAAALRTARHMAGPGRCVAVLGEMAELGAIAGDEHERVGELLARLRVDEVVTVGAGARRIAVGAEREGVEPEHVLACETADEAIAALRGVLRPGDLVLVKGSRVAGLERIAAALAPLPEETP